MNRNARTEETPSCASKPSASKAILEKDRLVELFGDDSETISSMLEIYLESQGELMEELANVLADNPNVNLAHTIKGSASNFGADAVSDLASNMGKACIADDLETVIATYPQLQDLSQKTNDAIKRYLADNQASTNSEPN